ncbi:MAG: T9SS type A sorting domain-containing protein [Bacteroidales bacterium]|nr:T9SS type A sorting domain-containing protein [Bacteroidales bacterium]
MKNFTMITAVLMTCASLFAQVDLDNGLVASYPFNGDATDVTGNGNDGVVTVGYAEWGGGTPILAADRFGNADKAYYFDMGGNIEIPYSTIINPGAMSLSWWIYMEERPNNDYMISMKGWNCYKVNLQTENKVFFTTKANDPDNPGSFIVSDRDHAGEGLVDSTWYHLAVTFGGGHMLFYIDGVMVKDWDNVPNGDIIDLSDDPVNLVLGQERPTSAYTTETGGGDFFKGTMDDFRIYNRVLTGDEVVALYELVPVELEDGLVASYPFDGDATDATGNGNDGVVTVGYSEWGAGTPVLTTDRRGVEDAAYYFDMGGNIEIPYSTMLNPGKMTLSWWIYMEERANNDYMISMQGWNCYKVNLQTENKVFATAKFDDPDNPGEVIIKDKDHAGDGLVDSTWYHLAVTFGGGHMIFYIDGVMVKDHDDVPDSDIFDISAAPHNLVFGQEKPTSEYTDQTGDGDFFKGKMDDFRIYNRVLNSAEILALAEILVSVEDPVEFNESFELFRTYPNPFSSATTIEFDQQEQGFTTLRVYNAVGQVVAVLISQNQMPGNYKYIWNADNLPTGVYFGRLSVDGVAQTKKLYLLK